MDEKLKKQLLAALQKVAAQDVEGCFNGEQEYNRSWLKRGPVGAYFTVVRPLDRLDTLCNRSASNGVSFDIFQHVLDSPDGDTGALNAVRDLRRYLLLVEAELVRRGFDLPLQRHNRKANVPSTFDTKAIMKREKRS